MGMAVAQNNRNGDGRSGLCDYAEPKSMSPGLVLMIVLITRVGRPLGTLCAV